MNESLTLTKEEKDEFIMHYIELIDTGKDQTHWITPAIAKILTFMDFDPQQKMNISTNDEYSHSIQFVVEW